MTNMRLHLLVDGANAIGLGDEAARSPCDDSRSLSWTVSFARAPAAADVAHAVRAQSIPGPSAGGDAAEHRAAGDFGAPQPRLQRPHRAGLAQTARLVFQPGNDGVGPLPFLVGLRAREVDGDVLRVLVMKGVSSATAADGIMTPLPCSTDCNAPRR